MPLHPAEAKELLDPHLVAFDGHFGQVPPRPHISYALEKLHFAFLRLTQTKC
jgi:hypothetical protein